MEVEPCFHQLCDLFVTDFFATDWRNWGVRGCTLHGNVCMMLMEVEPCFHQLCDLFVTDFFATDWRSMRLVQPLYAHIRIEDYNRRQVCNWSAIDWRLVSVDMATCLQLGKTDRRLVSNQSATGPLNLLTQMAKHTKCCML